PAAVQSDSVPDTGAGTKGLRRAVEAVRRLPASGRSRKPPTRLLFPRPACLRLGSDARSEPADQRKGERTRHRPHRFEKAGHLRREGNLVGVRRKLLQNLARATLLAHHLKLLLLVVRG